PDETSKKSLAVLERRLQWLKEYAEFAVNINSVLGSSIDRPEDALTIARRAHDFGFAGTVGIIHDHTGQLKVLDERRQNVYAAIRGLGA
ncbi:hypothetical protein OFP26_34560, partial [Escherichia coli]|nr:hypothetical protein [Escherichia coli]